MVPRVNHPVCSFPTRPRIISIDKAQPPFTNEDPVWLTIPNDPRNARYAMIIADSEMDSGKTMSYQLKNSSGAIYKVGGQVASVKAEQLKRR